MSDMTAVAPTRGAGVADGATPATPARIAAVLAVAVALLGVVLGPTGGLDGLLGGQAVAVQSGVVERQVGDDWESVPVGTPLGEGTVLRAPDGTATLQVPGGTVDLAEGTRLRVGTPTWVLAGSVVVQSPRVVVGDAGVTAQGPGTWRWDATGRVGAYGGAVVVTDATDREVLVRRLEQAGVRDAVVAERPRPYVYTDADPFDRQHLATALGVDDYVSALRAGLSADYGTAPQPRPFYTDFDGLDGQLVAALGDVGFDQVGERIGPPADVLVAAVVTDALVVDAGLPPQDAADEVRTLRLAGATWGLIAQGRDLDAGNVRAAAERALARRQLAEQQGTAVPAVAPAGGPAGASGSPDGPEGTAGAADPGPTDGGTGATGGRPAVDEPAPEPSDGPAPEEPGPLESIVDETGAGDLAGDEVGGLVDDVVEAGDDLLDGPDPEVSDPPVDAGADDANVLDTTGEVVEDTVGTVEGTVGSLLGE